MFRSVQIAGYRGFSHYELGELARVNLLVGRNNSGKTSVLEALYLLGAGGDPAALWRIANRRGERFDGGRPEIDVSHLFMGHELGVGSSFSITGTNGSFPRSVVFSIEDRAGRLDQNELSLLGDEYELSRPRLLISIASNTSPRAQILQLSRQGGLDPEINRRFPGPRQDAQPNVHFISTDSLAGNEMVRHWDQVQLTPNEELVLGALRFIDPSIEQIRSFGSGGVYGPRGGFIVKRKGVATPFPLGSLGDGAWRMLAMAIVLTQCAGGLLFIDEIDTGLHYTVMADMWRMIYSAAKQFDVQVFASTHSYDCVYSLSTICRSAETEDAEITIQRIEADRPAATPFSEAEIRTAAERHIEIR
jgi:hypothetical protein